MKPIRFLTAMALALGPLAAAAHVTVPGDGAKAGTIFLATFRVGHACKDANATTGIRVRLPEGFVLVDAAPRPGWTLRTGAAEVSWSADDAASALPGSERTTFDLRGRLPDRPGPIWFKVEQRCDVGVADWAELPTPEVPKPAFPAARLEVLPAN